jgi:C-terminal processing protease CtpA/Prc
MDSRFRGNDCDFERVRVTNDATTRGFVGVCGRGRSLEVPETMNRRPFLVAAVVLISCALRVYAKEARRDSHCDAPEYFGVCDPYVPGTIVAFPAKQPIVVVDTWHDGPAERAGVCPGDQIIAVNGVPAAENTMDRMLHEIVSEEPSMVALRIKRGDQTLEFHVRRARESTLAELSHQQYMRDPIIGRAAVLVPKSEKRAEFARYIDFHKKLEEREGFTRIEGLDVPVGTPPEQVKRIQQFSFGGPDHSREAEWVGPSAGKYSFGFTLLVLKDPSEALIDRVFPQSPALRAGLLPGDRVLEVDGGAISTSEGVKALILEPDQERSIRLKVERGGELRSIELRSQLYEQIAAADLRRELPLRFGHVRFDPDATLVGIGALYSPDPREAMVSRVSWPSPAFDAGLHVGDSILAVDGKPISTISREELSKLLVPEGTTPLALEISRLGKKRIFTVKPVTQRKAEGAIGRKPTKSRFVPQGCPAS